MSDPILIDAGPSPRGWSFWGDRLGCPFKASLTGRLGFRVNRDPLLRGSLGHVAQAHLHGQWGAEQPDGVEVGVPGTPGQWPAPTQRVTDPRALLSPADAISEACRREPAMSDFHAGIALTLAKYVKRFGWPPGRILAVEVPATLVLGTCRGVWGLWLIDPLTRDGVRFRHVDGSTVTATPLDCPGLERTGDPAEDAHIPHYHGDPLFLTRRRDLDVHSDQAYIWDHKHIGRMQASAAMTWYRTEGGFAAFHIIGRQLYGADFGGVKVNLIQHTAPWARELRAVPPREAAIAALPRDIWRAAHEQALDDLHDVPVNARRRAHAGSGACYDAYGQCAASMLEHGDPCGTGLLPST